MKAITFIKATRWCDSGILIVFVLAFAGATYNHIVDLIVGGLFPYSKMWGTPEGLNLFWTSLTILDPLAIAALMINVRAGYITALCIMLMDVPINVYANSTYWPVGIQKNDSLIMQTIFLVFLLSTIRRIWRLTGQKLPVLSVK